RPPPGALGDVLGRVAWVEGEVLTRAGDRGRTGDVQLGKLSWPLRGKGFSAAVAETGYAIRRGAPRGLRRPRDDHPPAWCGAPCTRLERHLESVGQCGERRVFGDEPRAPSCV